MPQAGHRAQLDTLRFLAFLAVFVYHVDEERLPYGALGVALFFVLSGFLITRLLVLNETGDLWRDLGVFYARRTLRIFPLYYLVLVVLLLAGRLAHPWWHFLYLHNVLMFLDREPPGITGHFWSLSVEEQFYLLYPLLLLWMPRPLRFNLLLTLLAGSMLSRAVLPILFPETRYWALLPVAGEYLIWGCLAGLFEVSRPAFRLPLGWLLLAGLSLHGLAAVDQFGTHLIHRPGIVGLYQTMHGVGFALVVLAVWRLPEGWVMKALTLRPVVYLGRISYGLYVFHYFCYGADRVLVEWFPWLGVVPGPVVVFAVTLGLAMISWHCYEAPINGMKRWIGYRRAPSRDEGNEIADRAGNAGGETPPRCESLSPVRGNG